MAIINIYGEFNNDTPQGYIAPASQIKDIRMGKKQDEINKEFENNTLNTAYLVCSTSGSTQAKTIDLPGFILSTNIRLTIKMEHAHTNTQYTPTLNIGGTGSQIIKYNGRPVSSENTWGDGEILDVIYDGTQYLTRTSGF